MEEVFSFLHVSFNADYFIVTPSIVFGVWVIYWEVQWFVISAKNLVLVCHKQVKCSFIFERKQWENHYEKTAKLTLNIHVMAQLGMVVKLIILITSLRKKSETLYFSYELNKLRWW